MKIRNVKVIKRGTNKNDKPYILIGLEDDNGRKLTSFDDLLLNIEDGTDVKGTVTEVEKDGKTYYNFKMDKNQGGEPYPLKGKEEPKKAVDWDKKDRLMNRMSALKASSSLYEGKGSELREEMIEFAQECFEWITGEVKEVAEEQPPLPPPPESQDEISLDDIPF